MFRQLSAVGFVCAAVLAAQPANAENIVMHAQVHYSDLNLATPSGQAELRGRVASAAAQACGGSPAFHSHYSQAGIFVRNDFELCRAEAIGRAEAMLRQRGVRFAYNR